MLKGVCENGQCMDGEIIEFGRQYELNLADSMTKRLWIKVER